MMIDYKVTFRTERPISQEMAQVFWRHGDHFGTVAARTYELTGSLIIGRDADADVVSTAQLVASLVANIVHPEDSAPKVTAIEVRLPD